MKYPKAQRAWAFTLIEMLVVIGIMGALAALAVPAIKNMKKADATQSAVRQLLDDVARARQYAISRRTTVYMIFCPSNFWNDPAFPRLPPTEVQRAQKLYEKQVIGYTFVTLRDVGDQPGQGTPRYLAPWRTLPEGVFIAQWKFSSPNSYMRITDPTTSRFYDVYGFHTTNNIPFPSEDAAPIGPPYVTLPYIAFNYLGQLTVDGVNPSGQDEYIPLARGSINFGHDANGTPLQQPPTLNEVPPTNSTSAFNLVHIDWLTGRARQEHQEISGT